MGNIKKNYRKIKRNRIIMWTLMWLNRSIATINTTFQLLDIYIYIDVGQGIFVGFCGA